VYDNESTDKSVEIAKSLGCEIVTFQSHNIQNEYVMKDLKNLCWKQDVGEAAWIIMADMDEWLVVTEKDLRDEQQKGVTILRVNGYDMVAESQREDLTDINLHTVNKAVNNPGSCKNLCFYKQASSSFENNINHNRQVGGIIDMNYDTGAHHCHPTGNVVWSDRYYINKHLYKVGLPHLIQKYKNRYSRTEIMRQRGMDGHYTDNVEKITAMHKNDVENAFIVTGLI
jgi:hypothetical protein